MQTLCLVQSSGAKLKSGGEIKVTDLWKLPGDEKENKTIPSFAATSIALRKKILKRFNK